MMNDTKKMQILKIALLFLGSIFFLYQGFSTLFQAEQTPQEHNRTSGE